MDSTVVNSQNLWTIIITWGMVQCFVIPLLLVSMRNNNKTQIYLLSLLILLFGLQIFNFLFSYFEWFKNFPALIWTSAPLWLLTGPVLYFFERFSTRQNFSFKPLHLVHLIPFLVAVFFMRDFLLFDGETKLQYFIDYYNNYSENLSSKPNYFTYAYLVSNIIYGGITLKNFTHYFNQVGKEYSSDYLFRDKWILFLISGFSIFWLIAFIHFLLLQIDFTSYAGFTYITYTFLTLFTQTIGFAALILNDTFFVTPVSEVVESNTLERNEPNEQETDQKGEGQELEDLQEELESITSYMEEEKPYLNPELRINDLSRMVDIPSHRLSFIINRALDKNFFEFVNNYRIKEVKTKLPDPDLKHLTLDAIAKECGFNSSASFYRVFKQSTGKTPKQYMDSLT